MAQLLEENKSSNEATELVLSRALKGYLVHTKRPKDATKQQVDVPKVEEKVAVNKEEESAITQQAAPISQPSIATEDKKPSSATPGKKPPVDASKDATKKAKRNLYFKHAKRKI